MIPDRAMADRSPYILQRMIEAWDPSDKPHCANCLHGKVSEPAADPIITCAKGYGKPIKFASMIRLRAARQFVPAARCPNYDDMGPACNVGGHEGR